MSCFSLSKKIEDTINIKAVAADKINKFINLLGNDSQLLTEEPIQSYDLFNKLNSNMDEVDNVDTELKYLRIIRDIRDKKPDLYRKIEYLPKKARVTRNSNKHYLITLLKSNKFKKIIKTENNETTEIDFFEAIKEIEAEIEEKSIPSDEEYFEYLHKNLTKI